MRALTLAVVSLAFAGVAAAADPTFRTVLGGDEDYGFALALSGRTLVVGNPGDSNTLLFDARTGAPKGTLLCPRDDGYFGLVCGLAVSADGNRIAVGGNGFVVLYDRHGNHLTDVDGGQPTSSRFGVVVSVRGNRVLVGAPEGANGGSAHLLDATTGAVLRSFPNPDPTTDDFGAAVALLGKVAVIGAAGPVFRGFDTRTGALLWTRDDLDLGGSSGPLVGLRRDVIVPGATRLKGRTGATVQTYTVPAGGTGDSLGAHGRLVAVGDTGFGDHGGVHLFDAETGAFLETVETTEPASELMGEQTVVGRKSVVTSSGSFSGDATLFGFRP